MDSRIWCGQDGKPEGTERRSERVREVLPASPEVLVRMEVAQYVGVRYQSAFGMRSGPGLTTMAFV